MEGAWIRVYDKGLNVPVKVPCRGQFVVAGGEARQQRGGAAEQRRRVAVLGTRGVGQVCEGFLRLPSPI